MGIILWIIFGAIAGWIASIIMKNNAEQGALGNIVVGVIGAIIGGYVMSFFGQEGVSGFNVYSFIVAILGAVILLGIKNALTRTSHR